MKVVLVFYSKKMHISPPMKMSFAIFSQSDSECDCIKSASEKRSWCTNWLFSNAQSIVLLFLLAFYNCWDCTRCVKHWRTFLHLHIHHFPPNRFQFIYKSNSFIWGAYLSYFVCVLYAIMILQCYQRKLLCQA